MHPRLPARTALAYEHCARTGLHRHGHASGIRITFSFDNVSVSGTLFWTEDPTSEPAQLDFHRVTEDAAEAITLACVYVSNGWVIRRRLQRGESADWLMVDRNNELVALEISGVNTVDSGKRRLLEKLNQVGRSQAAPTRAAGVIELRPPRARLATV